MKHALALLAALTLFSVLPTDAHAICDNVRLSADAMTFWRTYIGYSVPETWIQWLPGGCSGNTHEERTYATPAFWDVLYGESCGTAGSIKQYNTTVYFKPTTWQLYSHFGCTCSTTNPSQHECHWF